MGAPPRGSAPQPLRARAPGAVSSARPWEPFTWRQKFCHLEKFMTSVTSSACWLVFLNLPPACWFESERPIDFFFFFDAFVPGGAYLPPDPQDRRQREMPAEVEPDGPGEDVAEVGRAEESAQKATGRRAGPTRGASVLAEPRLALWVRIAVLM